MIFLFIRQKIKIKMKRLILVLSIIISTNIAIAEYTVNVPLESEQGGTLPQGSIIISPMNQTENWIIISPTYTNWVNDGDPFNCTNWSPEQNTVATGQNFTQTATDCEQNQTRTRQDREQETTTLEIRNVGTPVTENQTLINQSNTRSNIGTQEIWFAITPIYTSWINSGSIYGCTNWSPETNTVTIGQSFTQTANDCKQDQIRTRQDREQETTTLAIRDAGSLVTENQTITVTDSRNSVGTMENWISTTPIYTSWINNGSLYGCTNWSPATSTVTSGQTFTQTATDCKQDQTRTRQDREQETTTLAIRDAGSLVTENQTLTNQSNTRTATGTKVVTCQYNYGSPEYYVARWSANGKYDYIWNRQYIAYQTSSTTINSGGYKYTIGSSRHSEPDENGYTYTFYTICRETL